MRRHLLFGAALVLSCATGAIADQPDLTLVHIECSEPGGKPRRGTGVVVSADGMVLTARHVLLGTSPTENPATTCFGRLGQALVPQSQMTPQFVSARYDAAIMRYPGLTGAAHLTFCPIGQEHKRAAVIAAGFPLRSATGQPSERMGILATVEPDPRGLVESDAATTSGMSGGRVTFADNGALVGIVAGVDPDPATGYPNAYAILAASRIAPEFDQFGLATDPDLCAPKPRVVSFPAPADGPWVPADGDLRLGMKADEGVCYLVQVWGTFDAPTDSVAVILDDTQEYVLTGIDKSARDHGAEARCTRF